MLDMGTMISLKCFVNFLEEKIDIAAATIVITCKLTKLTLEPAYKLNSPLSNNQKTHKFIYYFYHTPLIVKIL